MKLNGERVISATIEMPRLGCWHAEVVLDAVDDEGNVSPGLSGQVTLEDDSGITFVGTVVRSGTYGDRLQAKIVGGAGGLSKVIPTRNYASGIVKVRAIVADILRDAGETLSSTSDQSILDRQLPKWHREGQDERCRASHALVHLTDHIGATWRVLRDGTVWIGPLEYPEASIGSYETIDEDWLSGCFTIAPDAPDLEPGTTFEGHRIEQVTHRITGTGIRTDAYLNSMSGLFSRMLGGIRRQIDYSRFYRARVAGQNADNTLQLVPDDPKMKGAGLDKVPIRLGLPGFVVKVQPGVRVDFGFSGGDPSKPYVSSFDEDGSEDLISVEFKKNGLGAPIARAGDAVYIVLPFTPAAASATPFPVAGIIQVGNPGLKG